MKTIKLLFYNKDKDSFTSTIIKWPFDEVPIIGDELKLYSIFDPYNSTVVFVGEDQSLNKIIADIIKEKFWFVVERRLFEREFVQGVDSKITLFFQV